MTDVTMLLAYVGPLSIVAGGAWRIAVKLTNVERKIDKLEAENRELRSELRALDRLLRVLVDAGRNSG